MDVGDRVGAQAILDVRGDLGGTQVVDVLRKHPGNVEGDVTVADDRDLLRLQRPGAGHIGVTVVPGDEVRRAVGTGQVDTGDVEIGVPDRAGGEDDGVVVFAQVRHSDVGPVVDVPQQADIAALQHFIQGEDDALDPRMVGGDPVTHEPVRGGQAFKQVDRNVRGFGKDVSGVDTGRAGSNDRHSQRRGARHVALFTRDLKNHLPV